MKVSFRADASAACGSGHVARCLTLAAALADAGATVGFVSREHDGNLCDLIEERGFPLRRLSRSHAGFVADPVPAHAGWLGAAWQDDVRDTAEAIRAQGAKPDWLVVDHYGVDHRWEKAMRAHAARILVIDDLADRLHDCDLLLDQNLAEEPHVRYAGKVPAACGLMLGPMYALLQPIYAELRRKAPARRGPIRRVLVFFGGTDHANLTERALSAIARLGCGDVDFDVVLPRSSPHTSSLQERAAHLPNVHLHRDLSSLAPLMLEADLALGAGGSTNWERLCMGLPALVVTVADNQRSIAEALARRNLIAWLGDAADVDEAAMARALRDLIDTGLDPQWSVRCASAVDGGGARKVRAAMSVSAAARPRSRLARESDEAVLLEWANDPSTRRQSFSQQPIPAPAHGSWFRKRLSDPDRCRIYVAETRDGVPLGQVRFEREDDAWEIHFALASEFRGRGLGRAMLEESLRAFRNDAGAGVIFGRVKDDNEPSRRLFASLGFNAEPDAAPGVLRFRRSA